MNDTENAIRIGNYRIFRRDDRNLQVDEFKTVTAHPGKHVKETRVTEKWVQKGYFSNVSMAAKGILQYMENDNVETSSDLAELISGNKLSEQMIVDAVKEAGLVL